MLHTLREYSSSFFIDTIALMTIGEACHEIRPQLLRAFEDTKYLRLKQSCSITSREGFVKPAFNVHQFTMAELKTRRYHQMGGVGEVCHMPGHNKIHYY